MTNSEIITKQIISHLCGKLRKNKITNGTVEIVNAHLTLDPMDPELSYGPIRPFPKKYAKNEEDWYASQDLCIKGHPGIEDNTTWKRCATTDGYINSNYGYLVFAKRTSGKSQFDYAMDNLVPVNGNSGRQSVIYYAGPEMQVWNNDGIHANHDFTCTFNTQHFIRNNKLYYIVNQRSCDLIYGWTFDFHHHCKVYQKMLAELNKRGYDVRPGKIYANFGSLHVYERHFKLINEILNDYHKNGGRLY